MKQTVKPLMIFCLLLCLVLSSACAETALTVNTNDFSCDECNAWLWLVKQSYNDMVCYYKKTLGINYWFLTYSNGQSVWDSVKADAFKQLVMIEVFCGVAQKEGLELNAEEKRICVEAAQEGPSDQGFGVNDLQKMLEKRLLAGKAYSYRLSLEPVDEESIIATIDPGDYIAYEVEYLYVPLYVYSANDILREEYISMLEDLKEFEGDYADAARLNAFLVAGSMTLCPADGDSDAVLLNAASTLNRGEVSEPITTDYGLFMIRLLDDSNDSLYEAEVEKQLLEARKRAYRAEYNRLYTEAEYSLNAGYWDTLKP